MKLFYRKSNSIIFLDGESQNETFPSINAAKRRSRELQKVAGYRYKAP